MNYGAVIVETRQMPEIIGIIHDHMKYLPVDWKLLIFCSMENYGMFANEFDEQEIIILQQPINNQADYNKLLTSKDFWGRIPFDKVLLFQHDSMIFKNNIMDFVQYDYVGAPWQFQEHGGNGGLSLRSKLAMWYILSKHKYEPSLGNEDIFFCNIMKDEDMNLAPREVCRMFACETEYVEGTFGCHAIEKYLTPLQVQTLKAQAEK